MVVVLPKPKAGLEEVAKDLVSMVSTVGALRLGRKLEDRAVALSQCAINRRYWRNPECYWSWAHLDQSDQLDLSYRAICFEENNREDQGRIQGVVV